MRWNTSESNTIHFHLNSHPLKNDDRQIDSIAVLYWFKKSGSPICRTLEMKNVWKTNRARHMLLIVNHWSLLCTELSSKCGGQHFVDHLLTKLMVCIMASSWGIRAMGAFPKCPLRDWQGSLKHGIYTVYTYSRLGSNNHLTNMFKHVHSV